MRIIKSDACVAEGAAWLAQQDARFSAALEVTGPLPLRLRDDGFGELFSAIISQQVSVASANAIWEKLCNAGLNDESAVASATEDDLRACGLSRQKIRYGLALAQAKIDYENLRCVSSADVIKTLTGVPGIGPWTAEIYAMFSLGHADVFPPGDLALQEAAKVLFDLPERPKERAFRKMALDWSPWQSVAARLLWAYYKHIKTRDGIR
ncbi:MAG: DNA-3-methyladenine glycosylase 2 family protein [Litoreibacter sp.]